MTILKEINGNDVILHISGRLDTLTAPELEEELNTLDVKDKLVFDFSSLAYISSAGLRILLFTRKKYQKNFIIKNVNEEIQDVFDMTGFSDILDIE